MGVGNVDDGTALRLIRGGLLFLTTTAAAAAAAASRGGGFLRRRRSELRVDRATAVNGTLIRGTVRKSGYSDNVLDREEEHVKY